MPDHLNEQKDPLQAPEGYFSAFNERLAERLPVKGRSFSMTARAAAVAAAVLLIPAIYWLTRPQTIPPQPIASVVDTTTPLVPDTRLDDESLLAYLQQTAKDTLQSLPVAGSQATAPVRNASLLTEEDLLRAGLLRAEEFETFDPML